MEKERTIETKKERPVQLQTEFKGPVFRFFTNNCKENTSPVSVFASVRTARTKIVGDTSPTERSHVHLSIKGLTACGMQSSHTPVCVITTGFQARSRGGRGSWSLSPEEITSREVELGCES